MNVSCSKRSYSIRKELNRTMIQEITSNEPLAETLELNRDLLLSSNGYAFILEASSLLTAKMSFSSTKKDAARYTIFHNRIFAWNTCKVKAEPENFQPWAK